MKIVSKTKTEKGYELVTEEGYIINAILQINSLGAYWTIDAVWGERKDSSLFDVQSLGNIDQIGSMIELQNVLKLMEIELTLQEIDRT